MNYVEWVLTRGAALWREREERLKKQLSRSVAGERTDGEKDGAAAENAVDGDANDAAEEYAETEMARLARRLTGGEAPDAAESAGALPVGMTARTAASAALVYAEESGESAAVWLRQELGKRAPAAAAAGAAKTEQAALLPRERALRETEEFSQSLERDARRYDGGFLFY